MKQNILGSRAWPLVVLLALGLKTAAQQDSVARAEMAFARYALDSGIKKSFLHFLDSNGVVFNQGAIHKGIPYWTSVEEPPGKLLWKPAYTGIARSGDLGFSTGPYEYRNARDSVSGSGNYSSVWIKSTGGDWKVLVDLGTSYKPSLFYEPLSGPAAHGALTPDIQASWAEVEKGFLKDYQQLGNAAFEKYITGASWFNINGLPPLYAPAAIKMGLRHLPPDLQFTPVAGGMATSADLCYVYGTVRNKDKTENYLRVWAHEADGWKLVLQVLKW